MKDTIESGKIASENRIVHSFVEGQGRSSRRRGKLLAKIASSVSEQGFEPTVASEQLSSLSF